MTCAIEVNRATIIRGLEQAIQCCNPRMPETAHYLLNLKRDFEFRVQVDPHDFRLALLYAFDCKVQPLIYMYLREQKEFWS